MKKSEKIEVRLSHEEKQKLTEIADGEGRSVSELVRGLISRYMAISKPMGRKAPWGKIAAVAIAGVLLGHLGTWAMMRGHDRGHIEEVKLKRHDLYKLTITASQTLENGRMTSQNLDIPIIAKDGYSEELTIQRQGADYKMKTDVTTSDTELTRLIVQICQLNETGCTSIAKQILLLAPEESTSTIVTTEAGNFIGMGVTPTFKEFEMREYKTTRTVSNTID